MRFVVTLIVPLIAWLLARVGLPGIDTTPLARSGLATTSLSIVALGLAPALSAFVLVEIAAALIPPWRRLRRNGPTGRRSLRRASLITTLVAAFAQGYFIARYFESVARNGLSLIERPGVGFELMVALTLVGGTALLLSLAWLVDQYGLGNGFSVLLGAAALQSLIPQELPDAKTLLKLGVAAALTGLLLSWHRRRPAPTLRDPITGLVPLVMASSLFGLAVHLSALGIEVPLPSGAGDWVLRGALVAVLAVPLALCFQWGRPRALVWPALARALVWLLALVVLVAMVGGEVLQVVIVTAVALDLGFEHQARRAQPTLVAAWPLPSVAVIDDALAQLRAAGIDAFPRAAYHRALYQFLAPYLQLDLLVPLDRAEEAQNILDVN